MNSWTVEATFKAELPEGVILAQGGASNGYCLALEGGKPVFTIAADGKRSRVQGAGPVSGTWTTVKAGWNRDTLTLSVDGANTVTSGLHSPILRQPNEGLQIGADKGTWVAGKDQPNFLGLIKRVHIYSGDLP